MIDNDKNKEEERKTMGKCEQTEKNLGCRGKKLKCAYKIVLEVNNGQRYRPTFVVSRRLQAT